MSAGARPVCLIYSVLPYRGVGWVQICLNIVEQFAAEGIDPVLVLPRTRRAMPQSIRVVECLPFPLSRLPWKYVEKLGEAQVERRYRRMLRAADPANTIAYFWPDAPERAVRLAGELGIMTVREMINCYQGTAKIALDQAYDRLGLPRVHSITERAVEGERRELPLYDHVFASNACCEASLADAGVESRRVIPSAYGWAPGRFPQAGRPKRVSEGDLRFLFVGTLNVRKGVPELLAAWERSRLGGELVLVGDVEPSVAPLLQATVAGGRVRHVPFTTDIADLYATSDVFVFPSHEEGGPQVVMEAAAHGLPLIVTAMGGGRILQDGANGLLVGAGDTEALIAAMLRMAGDRALVQRMSDRILVDAAAFAYPRIGRERGRTLMGLMEEHRTERRPVARVTGGMIHSA